MLLICYITINRLVRILWNVIYEFNVLFLNVLENSHNCSQLITIKYLKSKFHYVKFFLVNMSLSACGKQRCSYAWGKQSSTPPCCKLHSCWGGLDRSRYPANCTAPEPPAPSRKYKGDPVHSTGSWPCCEHWNMKCLWPSTHGLFLHK